MIIDYKVTNFRSFKNETEYSLKAGTEKTHNENLIRKKGLRILPCSVMYGANASGKSNLIMSLSVMRDIILSGNLNTNLYESNSIELFPFAYQKEEKPIKFEINFINQNKNYKYSFSIKTKFLSKEKEIFSEKLDIIDSKKNEINIFKREENKVIINNNQKALRKIKMKKDFLTKIQQQLNSNLDKETLFLTGGFKNIISNKITDTIIDFFKNKLIVVSDFTIKKASLKFQQNEIKKDNVLIWNKILDGFFKSSDFGPQKIAFHKRKKLEENQDESEFQLVSIYNDTVIPAELMESRGTIKLIDFALMFEQLFQKGGTLVIDEFDSAIHPELIKGIISLFNNQNINKIGAQLIFTTHNPIYLNNKIFRRDQINFVEKDTDTYESIIYRLSDFGSEEVRNDHNYLINYFKGNYGALPYVDFTKFIKFQEGEKKND
jgi:hypothetical protein